MSSTYIMNFEDGKIDDYGTLKYHDGIFMFRISSSEILKISKDGVYVNNQIINNSDSIYNKLEKWLDKALKR